MNVKRDEIAYTVGTRIRDFRIQKKMSQEALAFDSDIHPAYLSQVERGEKCPTVETVYKICLGLKISMSELMNFSLEPAPSSEEAIHRISLALSKVSSDKAVRIAGIVEEMVDM